MARIPDVQDDPVAGAPASTASITPTDFGLGEGAAMMARAASYDQRAQIMAIRAQSVQDKEAAAPLIQNLQKVNQVGFDKDAAAYTGAPGFADDQQAKFNANAAQVRADAEKGGTSPGVLSEYDRIAQAETNRMMGQAINHQGQVQAAPIAQATANAQNAQLTDGQVALNTTWQPTFQKMMLDHRPGDVDLAPAVAKGFDAAAAPILAAAPDNLRPSLQASFQAQKYAAVGKAQDFQLQQAQTGAVSAVSDQVNKSVNTILDVPGAYDNVVNTVIPQAVATLPASMQAQATKEFKAQAITARVQGLITAQQPQQAVKELQAGTYDADLDPTKKSELEASALAAAKRDETDSVTAATQRLTVEQQVQADIQAHQTFGRGSGQVTPEQVDQVLGNSAGAEYRAKVAAADKDFALHGSVSNMTNAQLHATEASPAIDPSTPNYAEASATDQARKAQAAGEIAARRDPSGAAGYEWGVTQEQQKYGMTPAAQTRAADLQASWKAVNDATAPQARYQAAGVYLSKILASQDAHGFDPKVMGVLPQTMVSGLVNSITTADPDHKAQALQSVASLAQVLDQRRTLQNGQVVRGSDLLFSQLQFAGLPATTLTAVRDYAGNSSAMTLYGRALANPSLTTPAKPKDPIYGAVNAALQPYLQSVQALPGEAGLQQARIDRSVLMARQLEMAGNSPQQAAAAVAATLSPGATYTAGLRFPPSLPAPVSQLIRGTTLATLDLVHNQRIGANAALSKDPDVAARATAAQVQSMGKWVTRADDSGVQLVVPTVGGRWQSVPDKWGRPVALSWSQLAHYGTGDSTYTAFQAPPPQQPVHAAPVGPAASAPLAQWATPQAAAPWFANLTGQAVSVAQSSRTAAQNAAVGGVPGSAHLRGWGYDLTPGKGSDLQGLAGKLKDAMDAKGIPYDQILVEGAGAAHSTGPHVHVSFDPQFGYRRKFGGG